jgi:isocitrate/isopropylmalate dehydrogenase
MTRHRIAAIAGDGVGTEVLPEGVRVVQTTAAAFGIDIGRIWSISAYYRSPSPIRPTTDRLSRGEKESFAGVHAALRQGASLSASRADGGSIALQHALSPRHVFHRGK